MQYPQTQLITLAIAHFWPEMNLIEGESIVFSKPSNLSRAQPLPTVALLQQILTAAMCITSCG